jgi:Na+-transporting NADH:ubiquinone oxidoreductase subunit NqrB
MNVMIKLSLLLNLAVLFPVCAGLITNADWAQASYGASTAARGILLSVYLAIAFASALFAWNSDPKLVGALLLVQIVYKLTTPVTVGTLKHPVVISNLVIAFIHGVTLLMIWRERSN